MSIRRVRVLCVHGVGRHLPGSGWDREWHGTIERCVCAWNPEAACEFESFEYDALFEKSRPNPLTYASALAKLMGSAAWHGVGDALKRRIGAHGELSDQLRWTAGMVAQWAADGKLRRALRAALGDVMNSFFGESGEKIVVAHSLGSLVTYDTFRRDQSLIAGARYVTFGSQIGHPAVRSTLGGFIAGLPSAASWHHLYNPHDDVMTTPLDVREKNFRQVDATFSIKGVADHDAVMYLGHAGACDTVWREAALGNLGVRSLAGPDPDGRPGAKYPWRGGEAHPAEMRPSPRAGRAEDQDPRGRATVD
ncbi:MAG: hypothetical protein JNK58_06605 [Phycisphaerae bacterium]|nr:hypothetical protein [Phycisphaerae bacterium]